MAKIANKIKYDEYIEIAFAAMLFVHACMQCGIFEHPLEFEIEEINSLSNQQQWKNTNNNINPNISTHTHTNIKTIQKHVS